MARVRSPSATPIRFARWLRVRDNLCAALLARERLLVVSGPAGTGKTMLLSDVAQMLQFAGWHVDFYQRGAAPSLKAFQAARGALVVDDADRLSAAELQAVLVIDDRPILLAGEDLPEDAFTSCFRVRLTALTPEDANEFVAIWLAQAAHPPLHPAMANRLIALSEGMPRPLIHHHYNFAHNGLALILSVIG